VRPSTSAKVMMFSAPSSASGVPARGKSSGISYTSVVTSRSSGTISRYSPWKATSKPSLAVITYRQAPPTRRSTSTLVTVPRSPLHHREISSGSV
jgi:hypothetical protein